MSSTGSDSNVLLMVVVSSEDVRSQSYVGTQTGANRGISILYLVCESQKIQKGQCHRKFYLSTSKLPKITSHGKCKFIYATMMVCIAIKSMAC